MEDEIRSSILEVLALRYEFLRNISPFNTYAYQVPTEIRVSNYLREIKGISVGLISIRKSIFDLRDEGFLEITCTGATERGIGSRFYKFEPTELMGILV